MRGPRPRRLTGTRLRMYFPLFLLFVVSAVVTVGWLAFDNGRLTGRVKSLGSILGEPLRRDLIPQPMMKEKGSTFIDRFRDFVLARREAKYHKKLFSYLPVVPSPAYANASFDVPEGVCLHCYRTLSVHPRIIQFDRLFTDHEAAHLVALGTPLLSRSGVVAKQAIMSVRTSSGARLPNNGEVAKAVNRRLLYVLNLYEDRKEARQFRAGDAERLEMLRYEGSQQYYGHLDTFGGIDGPIAKARRKSIQKFLDDRYNKQNSLDEIHKVPPVLRSPLLERGATMILFLQNNSEASRALHGGATTFPYSATGFDPMDAALLEERNITNLLRWWRQQKRFRAGKDSPCLAQPAERLTRDDVERYVTARSVAASSKQKGVDEETQLLQELLERYPPPRSGNGVDDVFLEEANGGISIGETIHVMPKIGSVVLFYDTYENGVADGYALHSGCPPLPVERRESMLEQRHRDIARLRENNNIKNRSEEAGKDTILVEHAAEEEREAASLVRDSEADDETWMKETFVKVIATKWFMLPIIDAVRLT